MIWWSERRRTALLLRRLESGDWYMKESSISGRSADADPRKFMLKNDKWADFYWVDVSDTTFRALIGCVSPGGFVDFDSQRKDISYDPKNTKSQRILSLLAKTRHNMESQ